MVQVVYKGALGHVKHKGADSTRPEAYMFVPGAPVEVKDEQDIAMFRRMAEVNPQDWAIVEPMVKIAVDKATEAVAKVVRKTKGSN